MLFEANGRGCTWQWSVCDDWEWMRLSLVAACHRLFGALSLIQLTSGVGGVGAEVRTCVVDGEMEEEEEVEADNTSTDCMACL